MTIVTKNYKLIICGIIIFLSGFVLNHKIKKNIYKNNNYINSKPGISNYGSNSNYKYEINNILFQVNILKHAITWNNSVINNYKKMLVFNINYKNEQKKIISKKINNANLSMLKEQNILNNMKNIITNHPYTYLKIFQINNYDIPRISLNNHKGYLNKNNNMQSFSSIINTSSTNINNISFQSEENIIGAVSTTSIISCLKSSIINKVNFNYSNIFYYSNNLENLSTLNKYSINDPLSSGLYSLNNNKFINNDKSNSQNKSPKNNNIYHKPYIFIVPFIGVGFITAIILGMDGILGKRKKKNDDTSDLSENSNGESSTQKKIKSSSEQQEDEEYWEAIYDIIKRDNLITQPNYTNIPLKTFSSDLVPTTDNIEAEKEFTDVWDSFVNWDDILTDHNTLEKFHFSPVPPTDNTETDRLLSHITVLKSDMPTHDEKSKSLSILQDPSEHGERTNLANTNVCSFSIDEHSIHIKPNELTLPESTELFDGDTISKITSWLSANYLTKKDQIKFLLEERTECLYISRKLFVRQFTNYMYQKVFNSKIPTVYEVHTNISEILAKKYLTTPDFEAFSTIQSITFFRNEKTIQSKAPLTTNGWFYFPKCHLKYKLANTTVTTEERLFINEQLKKLRNILDFLPDTTDSLKYNEVLLGQYLSSGKLTSSSSKSQDAITSFSNDILFDLKEVIMRYIESLNMEGIETDDTKIVAHNTKRNFNYVEQLTKTTLAKENFDMTHINLSDEEIDGFFQMLKL